MLGIETYVINPKAMTYNQLYGNFDSISQEFSNGVIGTTFQNCVYDKDAELYRRWIIFDGPVEPIWIEDLNTLLDENRILCLMNQEKIRMRDTMTIMFENHDLSMASPATVTRCGMIFLDEKSSGGWVALLESWLVAW